MMMFAISEVHDRSRSAREGGEQWQAARCGHGRAQMLELAIGHGCRIGAGRITHVERGENLRGRLRGQHERHAEVRAERPDYMQRRGVRVDGAQPWPG